MLSNKDSFLGHDEMIVLHVFQTVWKIISIICVICIFIFLSQITSICKQHRYTCNSCRVTLMVVSPSTHTLETYKNLRSISDQGMEDILGNLWNPINHIQGTTCSVHRDEYKEENLLKYGLGRSSFLIICHTKMTYMSLWYFHYIWNLNSNKSLMK